MHKMAVILLFICISFTGKQEAARDVIATRFPTPQGYSRKPAAPHSFTAFLRALPLKPKGALVKYYDGVSKPNRNVYEAVIDLPIGKRNLHQCADAVMRLRADYLFQKKEYDRISFHFTNGFEAAFSRWRKGERIVVKGNKVNWVKSAAPSDSYETYWKYMEMVFTYAGTASLSKELQSIEISQIQPGDVFIKGGFPGHAVIVTDVAENEKGQKVFMLAQSYMPAQELQVLKNPAGKGVWYDINFGQTLNTPEWTFDVSELKRFR